MLFLWEARIIQLGPWPVAQPKGAKEASVPSLAKSPRKFKTKMQAFTRVLKFASKGVQGKGAGQFNSSTGFRILAI